MILALLNLFVCLHASVHLRISLMYLLVLLCLLLDDIPESRLEKLSINYLAPADRHEEEKGGLPDWQMSIKLHTFIQLGYSFSVINRYYAPNHTEK